MPRKRPPAKRKPVSDKQRAEDDKLREALKTADLKAFDKVLAKAIKPSAR